MRLVAVIVVVAACASKPEPKEPTPKEPVPKAVAAYRDKVMGCIVRPDCDAVTSCLGDLSKPDMGDLRACDEPGANAVGVTAAEYAAHDGHTAVAYADVTSTKEAPIERCGIENANDWLFSLRCKDESKPAHGGNGPEAWRVRNVGPAGRCHSIVDLYRVPCPEGATDIYIDAYVCPK